MTPSSAPPSGLVWRGLQPSTSSLVHLAWTSEPSGSMGTCRPWQRRRCISCRGSAGEQPASPAIAAAAADPARKFLRVRLFPISYSSCRGPPPTGGRSLPSARPFSRGSSRVTPWPHGQSAPNACLRETKGQSLCLISRRSRRLMVSKSAMSKSAGVALKRVLVDDLERDVLWTRGAA